jgi:molecular chaperone GrpE (heat shock protein)
MTGPQHEGPEALVERLTLWFFREMADDQRNALFRILGWPDGNTHGEQRALLRKVLRDLSNATLITSLTAEVEALEEALEATAINRAYYNAAKEAAEAEAARLRGLLEPLLEMEAEAEHLLEPMSSQLLGVIDGFRAALRLSDDKGGKG